MPAALQPLRDQIASIVGPEHLNDVFLCAGIFLGVFFGLWVIKNVLLVKLEHLLKKTSVKYGDVIIGYLQEFRTPFFFVVALFASVQHLALPVIVHKVITALFLFALVFEMVKLADRVINVLIAGSLGKSRGDKSASAAISLSVRVVLWVAGLLVILSNLGINVTSLVASLGIGGLAISLALQNVFQDIFSSYSIVLDKPFEEGDFIIVGEHVGTVKKIGLKTTRIEALRGEEIVISNTELTSTRIQNFKQLERRRVVHDIGVTYDTPKKTLEAIPALVESVVDPIDGVDYDRMHFREFADSSLVFELVYHVNTDDYAVYMDLQQQINLAIYGAFEKEGIDFAFPTRTIHIEKGA